MICSYFNKQNFFRNLNINELISIYVSKRRLNSHSKKLIFNKYSDSILRYITVIIKNQFLDD